MKIVQNIIDGTATSYLLAYKSLRIKDKEVRDFYNDDISTYLFPMATIAAFSCEVALKNLLYIETGKKMRGHDLYNLFEQLKDVSKKKYEHQTIELYNMRANKLNSNEFYAENEFKTDLFKNKDTYTKCRYIYEGTQAINLDFLEAFMFSLNNACDDYEAFYLYTA